MSTANDALLLNLANDGFNIQNDVGAPNTTQGTATPIKSGATRVSFSSGSGNGALILPSILTNEVGLDPLRFIINDSPNAIKVFPAQGETQNGVANQSLSIPAGQSAICSKVQTSTVSRGGGPNTGTNDWRSAVIP